MIGYLYDLSQRGVEIVEAGTNGAIVWRRVPFRMHDLLICQSAYFLNRRVIESPFQSIKHCRIDSIEAPALPLI